MEGLERGNGEENASLQTPLSREKFLHVIMQTIRIICKKRICEGAQTEVRMVDEDSCQTHVEQGNDQNRKEIPGKGSSCFHFVLQNCCKFGRSRSQKLAKRGGGRNSAKESNDHYRICK